MLKRSRVAFSFVMSSNYPVEKCIHFRPFSLLYNYKNVFCFNSFKSHSRDILFIFHDLFLR